MESERKQDVMRQIVAVAIPDADGAHVLALVDIGRVQRRCLTRRPCDRHTRLGQFLDVSQALDRPCTVTYTHDEDMDTWQTAAGRARQT